MSCSSYQGRVQALLRGLSGIMNDGEMNVRSAGRRKSTAGESGGATALERYSESVANPDAWVAVARELMAAAAPLEARIAERWAACRARLGQNRARIPTNVQGVYFVLVGYAIENLAQAIIVRRDSAAIRKTVELDRGVPKCLKGHGLFGFVKRSRFPMQDHYEDLLRRLARHSIWEGRYLVPLTFQRASYGEIFDDGKEYHVAYTRETDAKNAKSLVVRLARYLHGKWGRTSLHNWIEELEANPNIPGA